MITPETVISLGRPPSTNLRLLSTLIVGTVALGNIAEFDNMGIHLLCLPSSSGISRARTHLAVLAVARYRGVVGICQSQPLTVAFETRSGRATPGDLWGT